MICGVPAWSAAPTVPTPPWWTTAAALGRSPSKGASSTARTSSPPDALNPAHPARRIPLRPARRRPSTTSRVNRAGSPCLMLPKPTTTGGGPATRKRSTSAGRVPASRNRQKPRGRWEGRHSGGAASRRGLQALRIPREAMILEKGIGRVVRPRRVDRH